MHVIYRVSSSYCCHLCCMYYYKMSFLLMVMNSTYTLIFKSLGALHNNKLVLYILPIVPTIEELQRILTELEELGLNPDECKYY